MSITTNPDRAAIIAAPPASGQVACTTTPPTDAEIRRQSRIDIAEVALQPVLFSGFLFATGYAAKVALPGLGRLFQGGSMTMAEAVAGALGTAAAVLAVVAARAGAKAAQDVTKNSSPYAPHQTGYATSLESKISDIRVAGFFGPIVTTALVDANPLLGATVGGVIVAMDVASSWLATRQLGDARIAARNAADPQNQSQAA